MAAVRSFNQDQRGCWAQGRPLGSHFLTPATDTLGLMRPKRVLVRFCILRPDPNSHSLQGIFQAAFKLRDNGLLESYEEEWLERELKWLRMHLPSPDCLRDDGNKRAISWFKPDAGRPIEMVRSIV